MRLKFKSRQWEAFVQRTEKPSRASAHRRKGLRPLRRSEIEEMTSPTPRQLEVLAWEVEIHSMICIVFATTKAKAQWMATNSYWQAYGKNGWPRAVATRAERFDKSSLRLKPKHEQRTWSEDYVISCP